MSIIRTDVREALAALRRLPAEAQRGAADGMAALEPTLEADLQGVRRHGDVTGATRASYRVYVASAANDGGGAAALDGAEAAERRNPGSAELQDVGGLGSDVAMVASGFTEYLPDLEREGRDNITNFWPARAAEVTQAAATGIRRRLGGR